MSLTQQQLGYFETFGFLKFPGLLANEVDEITRRFERVWADHGGGHYGREHDREQRSALLPFIDKDEYLSAMLDNPSIDGIAASILGDDYNYTSSDGQLLRRQHRLALRRIRARQVQVHQDGDVPGQGRPRLRLPPGDTGQPSRRRRFRRRAAEGRPRVEDFQPGGALGHHGHRRARGAVGVGSRRPGGLQPFAEARLVRRRRPAAHVHHETSKERYRDEHIDELREEMAGIARFWAESAYDPIMVETAGPARHGAPGAADGQRRPPADARPKGQGGDAGALQELGDRSNTN